MNSAGESEDSLSRDKAALASANALVERSRRLRRVTQALRTFETSEGLGSYVRRCIGNSKVRCLPPFISCDFFRVNDFGRPPHPSRGSQKITVVMDGTLSMVYSPSDVIALESGSVTSLMVGRGVLRAVRAVSPTGTGPSKTPEPPINAAYGLPTSHLEATGLNLFMDVPEPFKRLDSSHIDLCHSDLETFHPKDGVYVRVITGSSLGHSAKQMLTATPATILDITIEPDSSIDVPVRGDWNAFVFIVEGKGIVQGEKRRRFDYIEFRRASKRRGKKAKAGAANGDKERTASASDIDAHRSGHDGHVDNDAASSDGNGVAHSVNRVDSSEEGTSDDRRDSATSNATVDATETVAESAAETQTSTAAGTADTAASAAADPTADPAAVAANNETSTTKRKGTSTARRHREAESIVEISVDAKATENCRLFFCAAELLGQPIYRQGPFVDVSVDGIHQAFDDYTEQKNGFEGRRVWQNGSQIEGAMSAANGSADTDSTAYNPCDEGAEGSDSWDDESDYSDEDEVGMNCKATYPNAFPPGCVNPPEQSSEFNGSESVEQQQASKVPKRTHDNSDSDDSGDGEDSADSAPHTKPASKRYRADAHEDELSSGSLNNSEHDEDDEEH